MKFLFFKNNFIFLEQLYTKRFQYGNTLSGFLFQRHYLFTTMDSSILYMSSFIVCLLLSWYLYTGFFVDSTLQQTFAEGINSGIKFFFYLLLVLVVPLILFSSQGLSSGVLNAFAAATKENGALEFINAAFEPIGLVIVGSVLFQRGWNIRSVAAGIVEINGRYSIRKFCVIDFSKNN